MGSCADEDFKTAQITDERISISASVCEEWAQGAPAARGSDGVGIGQRLKGGYKMESEQTPDPLYIFETVSDRFEKPGGESPVPRSRGAKVLDRYDMERAQMGVYSFFSGRGADPFYMRNVPYAKKVNFWESTGKQYLWPPYVTEDNKLRFFAYHPYNSDDSGSSGNPRINVKKEDGQVLLRYTVPDSLNDQHDLLISDMCDIADSRESRNKAVDLQFHHALTSVRFVSKAGSMYPGVVTNITIKNVVGVADFDVAAGKWVEEADPQLRSFSFKLASLIDEAGQGDHIDRPVSTDHGILGTDAFTLMMIPQDSRKRNGPAPVIEITFVDDATKKTRVFKQELHVKWEKGKSVCYNITKTNLHTVYTFNVSVKGGAYMTDDGVGPVIDGAGREIYACGNVGSPASRQPEVTVESYFTVYQLDADGQPFNKGTHPAQWRTQVDTWDDSKDNFMPVDDPYWLKSMDKLHGNGNDGDKEKSVVPIVVEEIIEHDIQSEEIDWIREHQENYVDYDLSTCGLGEEHRNTANCYIISSPGSYKIPLVYGNAIKNGADNTEAYQCALSGSRILKNFVRHDNRPITAPWICDNTRADGTKIIPKTAKLVKFESVAGSERNKLNSGEERIQGLRIDDEGKFLSFNVYQHHDGQTRQREVLPSNAVIEVKDNRGETVWLYHIWITGLFKHAGGAVTTPLGKYEMMNYSLGQLHPCRTIFSRRPILLNITQYSTADSPLESVELHFEQEGWTADDYAQSLYYQFGRIDPVYAYYFRNYVDTNGRASISPLRHTFRTQENSSTPITIKPKTTIGGAIQDPLAIFDTSGRLYTTGHDCTNLWNNGTPDNPIKTVYDPCPPGYMVPPSQAVWDPIANGKPVFNREKYQFEFGSMTFPRGAYTRVDSKNRTELTHNFRYTSYWTSDYSNDILHAVSFRFTDIKDTHEQLNTPEFDCLYKHGSSFPAAYLLIIRPVKIPD